MHQLLEFIEAYLRVDALEQTTSELQRALLDTDLPRPLLVKAERFLNEADLVKFARYQPLLENALQAPEQGVDLVHSIKGHLQEQRQRAQAVRAEETIS